MTKFDLDVKRKFIELMESNKRTISSAAEELGISLSLGKRWWMIYQYHGFEGLSMKSGKYSGEFKVHVVKYMQENHLSSKEASAMFGIPSNATILKWERIYYEEGESGLFIDRRGRPKTEDMKNDKTKLKANPLDSETKENLIAEVKRLSAEVAYLKKSIALKEEKKSLQIRKKQR